jgi:hypothetical protein
MSELTNANPTPASTLTKPNLKIHISEVPEGPEYSLGQPHFAHEAGKLPGELLSIGALDNKKFANKPYCCSVLCTS